DRILRAIDLLIAGVVLVLASPLLLLFTIAIRVSSGRPILYRGARVGQAGRVYQMYKFRTLAPAAEPPLGPVSRPSLARQSRGARGDERRASPPRSRQRRRGGQRACRTRGTPTVDHRSRNRRPADRQRGPQRPRRTERRDLQPRPIAQGARAPGSPHAHRSL